MEIWKDILGYEGLYQVSNLGRVKSVERKVKCKAGSERIVRERIMKQKKDRDGYNTLFLSKYGFQKTYKIHRLVASAFIPNPQKLPLVNHKDECKTNNCVTNLEWCTDVYNKNYGTAIERRVKKQSKKVLCVETGIIYSSINEVQRLLGYNTGGISNCCNGKIEQTYGYHWKYVE